MSESRTGQVLWRLKQGHERRDMIQKKIPARRIEESAPQRFTVLNCTSTRLCELAGKEKVREKIFCNLLTLHLYML